MTPRFVVLVLLAIATAVFVIESVRTKGALIPVGLALVAAALFIERLAQGEGI